MEEKDIEKEIQAKGLTAPRITPADIEANIVSEHYFTAWEGAQLAYWGDSDPEDPKPEEGEPAKDGPLSLLTFCVLVLRNGFTVTGESACASPENFDAELGRKIARENAVAKMWPLMGYELRSKLADMRKQMDYKFTPRNVLPNGLTLLQVNPDCAAQLDPKARDHGWLYVKGADGQWVTHRKLEAAEIDEANDQAADMAVRQGVFSE